MRTFAFLFVMLAVAEAGAAQIATPARSFAVVVIDEMACRCVGAGIVGRIPGCSRALRDRFPDVAVSPAFLPRLTSFESTKRALQGGFDNITNHANPRVVNSEINSPQFRTFGAVQGRDFTSRIRLRERK